jgi:hypothetical protein
MFTPEQVRTLLLAWRARDVYIVHGPEETEEVFQLPEAVSQSSCMCL